MRTIFKTLYFWEVATLVAFLFFFAINQSYALDVTLQWDGSPDAHHYEVYWRTALQNYDDSRSENVGLSTTYDFSRPDDTYYLAVKAVGNGRLESDFSREVCVIDPKDVPSLYNRGWGITSGDIKGFKVFYHSNHGITPTLWPSDLIDGFLDAYIPVGKPLNLQPSGATFKDPKDPNDLRPPVTIFIPCPGFPDPSGLGVALYDEENKLWILASDGAGNIQPAAENWLAAEPVPHDYDPVNDNPATIEIQLYHFSGAQAALDPLDPPNTLRGNDGGCFIDTLLPAHCH